MLMRVAIGAIQFVIYFALFNGLDIATTAILGVLRWPGFSPMALGVGALVLAIRGVVKMELHSASENENEQGRRGSRFM